MSPWTQPSASTCPSPRNGFSAGKPPLFPSGRSGGRPITAGAWRIHPIRVVSGATGQERVHFEGPEPSGVPEEMAAFLEWLNGTPDTSEASERCPRPPMVRDHPPLRRREWTHCPGHSRHVPGPRRQHAAAHYYSMSAQIHAERAQYYRMLEQTQRAGTDITPWMSWFLGCLERALRKVTSSIGSMRCQRGTWRTTRHRFLETYEVRCGDESAKGITRQTKDKQWT